MFVSGLMTESAAGFHHYEATSPDSTTAIDDISGTAHRRRD
jgi:hypothetical protein